MRLYCRYRSQKGKGQSDFSDWPLFMPAISFHQLTVQPLLPAIKKYKSSKQACAHEHQLRPEFLVCNPPRHTTTESSGASDSAENRPKALVLWKSQILFHNDYPTCHSDQHLERHGYECEKRVQECSGDRLTQNHEQQARVNRSTISKDARSHDNRLRVTPLGLQVSEVTELPPKEKATLISQRGLYLCRQRPTLPHTFACSTIGPAGLNFRVRDGNGWIPRGKITDKSQLSAISRQLSATMCCADFQG